MELKLLKVFVAVAEQNSIIAAAQQLHCVQSNVSARLKQLEAEIALALFTRSKKGMQLTEAGVKLLPQAKDILNREREVFNSLKQAKVPDTLKLAAPDTFIRTHLYQPLSQWMESNLDSKNQPIKLSIKTAPSNQVLALLQSHQVDIGVVIARQAPHNLNVITSIQSELCVVVPKNISRLTLEAIADKQPLLLSDSCFFGQSLMQMINELGVVPKQHEYIASIETILICVSLGIGYSVLPKTILQQHPMLGKVNVLPYPGNNVFSFYKVCLLNQKDSTLVRSMTNFFSRQAHTNT